MSRGRFGIHGGQFIPETLMSAVTELEKAYEYYKKDPQFKAELSICWRNTQAVRHVSTLQRR